MDVDNDDAREEVERDPIPQVAAAAPPAAAAVPLINLNLEAIRQRFSDPREILLSSRGDSTFSNHQRENTKLIFYLYENNHQFLYDEFYESFGRLTVSSTTTTAPTLQRKLDGGGKDCKAP